MNWVRTLLDGIMMSGWFNLATGMLLTINPAIFTTAYPTAIQKVAPKNPKAVKHKLLFGCFVILPMALFGIFSAHNAGIEGFWNLFWTGYVEMFLVNLGDFFGLDLALREILGERWELPGTHGHPCYNRKTWLLTLGLPEHFILWPLIVCPLMGFACAGVGMLL